MEKTQRAAVVLLILVLVVIAVAVIGALLGNLDLALIGMLAVCLILSFGVLYLIRKQKHE
ncbi:MAG: hypothetical protein PHT00_05075 [Candidatus Methanomethylophilus sp.]|nr:hypothetical protein [Methanomethylophilus sp.]MDD3233518.1 hypothetical protein [Methanomethylophilus sp.]MDD4222746.1 hypothetical protein [Methanomethylophilus sp.]MDD4668993.1 hypothetical protein [Methanomethylophilus sp.]